MNNNSKKLIQDIPLNVLVEGLATAQSNFHGFVEGTSEVPTAHEVYTEAYYTVTDAVTLLSDPDVVHAIRNVQSARSLQAGLAEANVAKSVAECFDGAPVLALTGGGEVVTEQEFVGAAF